jgi:hypothetical protein
VAGWKSVDAKSPNIKPNVPQCQDQPAVVRRSGGINIERFVRDPALLGLKISELWPTSDYPSIVSSRIGELSPAHRSLQLGISQERPAEAAQPG